VLAFLRVIVSRSWGPALCHHAPSGYQPHPLVPNPDGVVVCTAPSKHKSGDRRS
jgi:hypothetical protein